MAEFEGGKDPVWGDDGDAPLAGLAVLFVSESRDVCHEVGALVEEAGRVVASEGSDDGLELGSHVPCARDGDGDVVKGREWDGKGAGRVEEGLVWVDSLFLVEAVEEPVGGDWDGGGACDGNVVVGGAAVGEDGVGDVKGGGGGWVEERGEGGDVDGAQRVEV